MAVPYDVEHVEKHWRDRWEATGLVRVDLDDVEVAEVFVDLVEFPYPCAEGLDVGPRHSRHLNRA